MSLYKHNNGEIMEYTRLDMPLERDIEDFLHRHPEVVEKDIMIVGRQVQAGNMGIIDLLGIDRDGNVVVIEVKKGTASRDVVSQILHYAVWARDIEYNDLNKAYNDLNKKEGESGGRPHLHAAVEDRFGGVPPSFNSSQRLYIVGEEIDQRTADICTYLSQNRIKISCIRVEFFGDGKGNDDVKGNIRAVHAEIVTEKQGDDDGFDKWDYNMNHYEARIKDTINDVISYMENELGCSRAISESAATCAFYTDGDHIHGVRFAVIYAYKTKDYGSLDFVSDPGHDFHDGRVTPATWTFGDIGRTIKIVPENIDLITKCAKHAHDVARGNQRGGIR